MPKMKTHSGTGKRVKVTGSGKILRQQAEPRHLLEHKSCTPHPAADGTIEVAPADAKRVKKLLGR